MPYPFVRPGESTSPPKTRTHPGLRVVHPDGTAFFFPGDEFSATLVMNLSCPPEVLQHPTTRIEYGEKCGGVFASERVLKEGAV